MFNLKIWKLPVDAVVKKNAKIVLEVSPWKYTYIKG